jgi:hypothetical protein
MSTLTFDEILSNTFHSFPRNSSYATPGKHKKMKNCVQSGVYKFERVKSFEN